MQFILFQFQPILPTQCNFVGEGEFPGFEEYEERNNVSSTGAVHEDLLGTILENNMIQLITTDMEAGNVLILTSFLLPYNQVAYYIRFKKK